MKSKTKAKNQPKKKPASPVAPPSTSATAPSLAVDGFRNEGQRRLTLVDASHAAVAMKLDVSKQVVSMWRQGKKMPAVSARTKLATVYGIPVEAWDLAPGAEPTTVVTAAPSVTSATPDAPSTSSTLHDVLALIAGLKQELRARDISATVRRGINADLTRLLSLRARLEKEETLLEERIVLEHPFYRRIRSAIVGALAPYPDAARAVVRALEAEGA
jgi:transcriptional regulator with XRE-family HTH domain